MKLFRTPFLAALAALVVAAAIPAHAADPYPRRIVKPIVTFPPGGPVDVIAAIVRASGVKGE